MAGVMDSFKKGNDEFWETVIFLIRKLQKLNFWSVCTKATAAGLIEDKGA